MKQSLVVFGGSGFIGQAVCHEAIKQNISVISISKHGKPKKKKAWMSHPLMTWKTIDIFKDDSWQQDIKNTSGCINLIGILFENKKKNLTYKNSIIEANSLISAVANTYNKPYLFLSAKTGPRGYIKAKKKAEKELMALSNPVIIIRSGLVTTKRKPLKLAQGAAIKTATHITATKNVAEKAYPVPLNKLVATMLTYMNQNKSLIIADIR